VGNLSAAAQQRLITSDPAVVGWLDGWVPGHGEPDRVHQRLCAGAGSDRPVEVGDQQAELAHLEGIGFNTSDLGHAIVSYGDPDTAQNVATYVPGLGSGLGSTGGGDLNRAAGLYDQAHFYDPKASLASVYWLGYCRARSGVRRAFGSAGT
jgi:hypothetical protein